MLLNSQIYIKNDRVVCFDCDGTLIVQGKPDDERAIAFVHYGVERFVPHKAHIEALVEAKREGKFVIVWSHRGSEWVNEVIKKLGLENYVDLMMPKPTAYVDDLPADEWMNRVFISE